MPMLAATMAAKMADFLVPATNDKTDLPPGIGTGAGWPGEPVGGPLYSVGQAWAYAYAAMFAEGGGPAPPVPGPVLEGCQTAMAAAMDGALTAPGLGPVALLAGVSAFWAAVSTGAVTLFPGSLSATPPTLLPGLPAAFAAAGAATLLLGPVTAPPAPLEIPWDRSIAIASASLLALPVYASSLGGFILYPGPVSAPFV